MTKYRKLRGMIAAMTTMGVLCAMPAGFAAEEQAAPPAVQAMSAAQTQVGTAALALQSSKPIAIVRVGKKWGAVTPSGNLAIPAEYDEISSYSADAVAVRQGKTWGIVRLDGTVIVPAIYKTIQPLSADVIIVSDAKDKVGAYNTAGRQILPVENLAVGPFNDGISCVQRPDKKYVFCRRDGSLLTNDAYDVAQDFSEGLAAVKTPSGKYGFIDTTGTMVIPAAYDLASVFKEGLCRVQINKKAGFIDKSGTMVIPPQFRYEKTGSFFEGLAMMKEKKHWAFIDHTGKVVIQTRYEDVSPFENGLAEVRREVKVGLLGGFLTTAVSFAINIPVIGMPNDYLGDKTKRGYIDKTGAEIISTKNDYNSPFFDGMALVRVKSKWGMVDRKGAYVVEPKYKGIHFFYDDLAAVQDGDKWGFVGRDGKIVIAPTYDEVHDFTDGIAAVRQGSKSFFIDKTGRVPFLLPSTVTEIGMFNEGFAPVKIGDKWGFIDHTGTVVIPPTYNEVRTHQYETDRL